MKKFIIYSFLCAILGFLIPFVFGYFWFNWQFWIIVIPCIVIFCKLIFKKSKNE